MKIIWKLWFDSDVHLLLHWHWTNWHWTNWHYQLRNIMLSFNNLWRNRASNMTLETKNKKWQTNLKLCKFISSRVRKLTTTYVNVKWRQTHHIIAPSRQKKHNTGVINILGNNKHNMVPYQLPKLAVRIQIIMGVNVKFHITIFISSFALALAKVITQIHKCN